jgi:hypothetical protein
MEEGKLVENIPVLIAAECVTELDSSLTELQRQQSSTVVVGDNCDGLDNSAEPSCSDIWINFPYSHLTWDEVEHDMARAENMAATGRCKAGLHGGQHRARAHRH